MVLLSTARLDRATIRVMKQIKRRKHYRLKSWKRAENEKGMETMSEVYRAKGERLDLSEGDAE